MEPDEDDFNKYSGHMEPDEDDFNNPLFTAIFIIGLVAIITLAIVFYKETYNGF